MKLVLDWVRRRYNDCNVECTGSTIKLERNQGRYVKLLCDAKQVVVKVVDDAGDIFCPVRATYSFDLDGLDLFYKLAVVIDNAMGLTGSE